MQTETPTPTTTGRTKGRRFDPTTEAAAAEAARPAKAPKTRAKAKTPAAAPKTRQAGPSKADIVMKLLHRAKGATGAELQEATGWQSHTVRGFISATKKKGVDITSTKTDKGTLYQAPKQAAA